ncbi:MAG: sugar phosphorylase [Chromatiaceae bacterium]
MHQFDSQVCAPARANGCIVRLEQRLTMLYGPERAPELTRRMLGIADRYRQRRVRQCLKQGWDEREVVLITYANSLQSPGAPPLRSLKYFLETYLAESVSLVHVLPFFPYSSDDGFSVTDFRAVHPELGTWEDVLALAKCFDLAFDLVLNHCSREHLWLVEFIRGDQPGAGYFIDTDARANLSMVVRPRTSPLLTAVHTPRGLRHVWATFGSDQIDLNYANPEVLLEMVDTLFDYLRHGARLLRLDAVAYLWKEIGTPCIHLPQTHQVVKLFRDLLDYAAPGALLMTETNVPHAENIRYFGDGDEAHIVYQFSLPPLLLHALWSGNTDFLNAWARDLAREELPPKCTFLNFTASHDGVGLRPLEGLIPKEELDTLLDAMRQRGGYISTKANSDGTQSPYELNISYFDAFGGAAHGSPNPWQVPKFLVSQAVALSFRGIPAVYIHSLTATPNDTLGVETTGMTRSINRRRWDLHELERLLADARTATGRVFRAYRHLLALRRAQAAFHPDAPQHVLPLPGGVFGLERRARDGAQRILALFNFTDRPQPIRPDDLPGVAADGSGWLDLIGGDIPPLRSNRWLLPPYGTWWLSNAPAACFRPGD